MRSGLAAVLIVGVSLSVQGSPSQAPGQPATAPAPTLRADFLRVIDRPRVAPEPSAPVRSLQGGYEQELLSFSSESAESVPVLVLKKPGQDGRRPVVIALHGTGGSKESMRADLTPYVERGFLGVSLDAPHHGERATAIPGLANPYQSAMLRSYRTGQRHPYLYDTVWDVMRLVDYLVTRSDVDPARIGIVGNSKGGTEAYLAAAADPRIAVVAPWIGVQSFGWSLRRPAGWEARIWTLRAAVEAAALESREAVNAAFVQKFYDRIAPGLVDRFDGPAMLTLIAPRPLLIVNSDSDPRSPLGGVREAVAAAERAYAATGSSEKFRFVLQVDAAHEVTPASREATLEWFERYLGR